MHINFLTDLNGFLYAYLFHYTQQGDESFLCAITTQFAVKQNTSLMLGWLAALAGIQ
jgi:hypothetical protein